MRGKEMNPTTPQPLVGTRTAALAVGVNPLFLYRNAHELSGVYRAGRALRWDIEELRAGMRVSKRASEKSDK